MTSLRIQAKAQSSENIRSAIFTAIFVALAVAAPFLAHQFNLAGPKYLPLHFFVLVAALLLGWRAGLVVGIFAPLISYSLSGSPVLLLLPQVVLEVCAYALFAGLFYKKFSMNIYLSLTLALIFGRVLVLAFVFMTGHNLVNEIKFMSLGWMGILLQILFVPLIVKLASSKR